MARSLFFDHFCILLLILCLQYAFPKETTTDKVRVVTKEELARHDGNHTKDLWLSIMSKVYDVTAGQTYYGEGAPYSVFVGRDGNVPFVTGTFNEEEAAKSILTLSVHQVTSLESWTDFYDKEEKYPFIGLLEGELYDSEGNPTEVMGKVQEMIAEGQLAREAQKKKTADIIARRKIADAEKKKRLAEKGEKVEVKQVKAGEPRVIESLEVEAARTAEATKNAKKKTEEL